MLRIGSQVKCISNETYNHNVLVSRLMPGAQAKQLLMLPQSFVKSDVQIRAITTSNLPWPLGFCS